MKKVFKGLQKENIVSMKVEFSALDSTCSKVHPNGCGAYGRKSIVKTSGGWNTKLHLVSADDKIALGLRLYASNEHDAPKDRKRLLSMGMPSSKTKLLMDRAYEVDGTRETAEKLGYTPVVPPKTNRKKSMSVR